MRLPDELVVGDDYSNDETVNIIENFAPEFGKSDKIGMMFSDAELVGENLEPLGCNLWNFVFVIEEQRKAEQQKLLES